MAQFCKKHCKEIMGIEPEEYPEWVVKDGFICESCGWKYLEKPKGERMIKCSYRIYT